MWCQWTIGKAILDYLLAVKGNQPRLEKVFKEHFRMHRLVNYADDYYSTTETSYGRKETRLHVVSNLFDDFVNLSFYWPRIKSVGVAMSFRKKR